MEIWNTGNEKINVKEKRLETGKQYEDHFSITLSTKWAANVFKSLDWVNWRGTTKRGMNPALYEERTFSWKIKISQIVPGHNINEK